MISESGSENGSRTAIWGFFDVTYPSFSHSLLSSSIYVQTLLRDPHCALIGFHCEEDSEQDLGRNHLGMHILLLVEVQNSLLICHCSSHLT